MTVTDPQTSAAKPPRLGENPEHSPAWQWPRRFGLSTLLLGVLLICIPLAVWGVRLKRTRVQQDVVEQLEAWGGQAGWYEGVVMQLTFRGDAFQDQALRVVDRLPHLQRMVFIDTPITVDSLRLVASLDRVRELQIRRAGELRCPPDWPATSHAQGPGDAGPQAGAEGADRPQPRELFSETLDSLALEQTKLDHRIVPLLTKLPQLKRLSLAGTPVGDEAVPTLARLTQLEVLVLEGTEMSEEAVAQLRLDLPKTVIFQGMTEAGAGPSTN